MKTIIRGLFLFLILVNLSWSQNKFEDAVALNFRNTSVASAGFYDNELNLNTAMIVRREGTYYLEIGKYDAKGSYSAYKGFDLSNYEGEAKVKFNADGSRIAILEISPDNTVLSVFDVSAGVLINDIDVPGGNDFFITPDAKYAVVSGSSNSVLADVFNGEIVLSYGSEVVLGMSRDGNTLFSRNGNNISYLETKTGKKIRGFALSGFKTIEFDERGELIICSFGSYIKLFKLTENNIVGVKEVLNVSNQPRVSAGFNYFILDNMSGSERGVYNIGGTLLYKARIDKYNPAKTVFIFSKDENRMALLTERGIDAYDFDMMRYYNKLVQKYPDLFLQDVKFETDKDQENRADRIKLQKDVMVKNVADEMKVSEGIIRQNQKNSLGLVEVKIIGIGIYDPASELYDINIAIPVDYEKFQNVSTKVKVPKFQAEVFTGNVMKFKAYALRQLNREQTGLDVFNVTIVNDLNSTNYRCLMHRTLPAVKMSCEEQYNTGQKFFEMRNWYEAILHLSDMPEDFSKNNTVDYMLAQAIPAFFEEKWSGVLGLSTTRDSLTVLRNLSDFPQSFKLYSDVEKMRQNTINNIMDGRLEYANYLNGEKRYSEAIEYMDAWITPKYFDKYSFKEYDYEYYKSKALVLKNTICVTAAKISMEVGNYSYAYD
ncbi:MAG: hypothetical protein MUE56_05655, partial [Ignavibacteria bacterium]|nr:hypothetical protein [Ignavibacteria bacterium]